ncbi:uncharacterized protein B0H18DRAFT_1022568 [Fomitopsis serialis]|uniref:uncharacterized protein n=1 Tax=Fomitopsis serialis TaxID=139415 RepID=UPI0020080836|nr:uncharacterized protein B0H18DRAFT_1022568 [Neoantrodia serialis]KAH9920898.1 hypothetical protein B0H18DRAFT_1022568 [Neoantrodia serialis]
MSSLSPLSHSEHRATHTLRKTLPVPPDGKNATREMERFCTLSPGGEDAHICVRNMNHEPKASTLWFTLDHRRICQYQGAAMTMLTNIDVYVSQYPNRPSQTRMPSAKHVRCYALTFMTPRTMRRPRDHLRHCLQNGATDMAEFEVCSIPRLSDNGHTPSRFLEVEFLAQKVRFLTKHTANKPPRTRTAVWPSASFQDAPTS